MKGVVSYQWMLEARGGKVMILEAVIELAAHALKMQPNVIKQLTENLHYFGMTLI